MQINLNNINNKLRFISLLILVIGMTIIGSNAYSQDSFSNYKIQAAIKTPSELIADFETTFDRTTTTEFSGGFCHDFLKNNLKKVQITKFHPSVNNDESIELNPRSSTNKAFPDSKPFPINDALKKGIVEIMCGSAILKNTTEQGIAYSSPYFSTGLKLLVRGDVFRKIIEDSSFSYNSVKESLLDYNNMSKDEDNIKLLEMLLQKVKAVAVLTRKQTIVKKIFDDYPEISTDINDYPCNVSDGKECSLKQDIENGSAIYVDDSLNMFEFLKNNSGVFDNCVVFPIKKDDYLLKDKSSLINYVISFSSRKIKEEDRLQYLLNDINSKFSNNKRKKFNSKLIEAEEELEHEAIKLQKSNKFEIYDIPPWMLVFFSIVNQVLIKPLTNMFSIGLVLLIIISIIAYFVDKKNGRIWSFREAILFVKSLF